MTAGAGGRRDVGFVEFARQSQGRLHRQAYLLTGQQAAAADLVQTTLLKLYVAWPRVESPLAYAHRVMGREFLRSAKGARREQSQWVLVEGVGSDDPPPDPAESLTLMDALAELAPRMRAVLVLRFWEDLSVRETARLLGCTEGTVKSATSKGLAHLRARLGSTFIADEEITS